jgi:hypothetical protein
VSCVYSTDHFRVAYTVLGPMAVPAGDENGNDVPDYVENVAVNLEASWSVYVGLGYQPPDELPIRVTIGLTFSGSGVVGPNQIIHLSNDNGDQYLPRHELFHVFQWEYGGDSVSDRVGWFARTGRLVDGGDGRMGCPIWPAPTEHRRAIAMRPSSPTFWGFRIGLCMLTPGSMVRLADRNMERSCSPSIWRSVWEPM